MEQQQLNKQITILRICVITFLLTLASFFLFSFTLKKVNDEFLKQLGISKTEADKKIMNSMLLGSFDVYGIKNVRNIAIGNRSGLAKNLLTYTKKHVNSAAFINAYKQLKDANKPTENTVKTPEQMQAENIEYYKKGVLQMEETIKKADEKFKNIFQKSLDDGKKRLVEAENPNNKIYVNYRKNYDQALKDCKAGNERLLADWENEYPTNHMLFVKKRLQQFLNETADIDFTAETTLKNGKNIFLKREYESKGNRWKMGYRAGKDVVETSRNFVQEWMNEIK